MIDRTQGVKTADGTMDVYVAHPEGRGPFPIVIQIMDALGMREELHAHARRAASWGYYVLAPDLFYRDGLKGPLDFSNPDGMKQIRAAMTGLTEDRATRDVQAALALADGDVAAARGKIGIYGFCMGGRLTLVLSQTLGARVAAGASIHPGGLVTDQPNSPHHHLDQVKAELYFGIADKDNGATPDQIAQLEKALQAKHIAHQVEWHTGALHGFMMPSRRDVYNESAAEKAWGRIKALFARTLS